MKFSDSIQYLKGIGEKRAVLFKSLGIVTIEDLFYYLPRDYEDRSVLKNISDLSDGDSVCVRAGLTQGLKSYKIRRSMHIIQAIVSDGTGLMKITWFNTPYIEKMIRDDCEYVFYGKAVYKGNRFEMTNPVVEYANDGGKKTGKIVPIYSLKSGLSQTLLRDAISNALKSLDEDFVEILSEPLRKKYNLIPIQSAMLNMHSPVNFEMFERAKRRMAFEELLIMQLGISGIKNERKKYISIPIYNTKCITEFAENLNFELTNAQKRTINEVCLDMRKSIPMNRLIQGDVGSGKTIVAAAAMFATVKSGLQAAMMAPTEILAKQHYLNISKLFLKWDIKTVLLTGGQNAKEKRDNLAMIEKGDADIVIGTHALITQDVKFKKLALAITDEQHRFGVRQRSFLSDKGENAHTLVMTATPIPRTLSLIIYSDLDVSIIDELPPGRKVIQTFSVEEKKRTRVFNFIKNNIDEGKQAYIVCPLVEESESMEAKAATEYAENLKKGVFSHYRISVLHGKLKVKEKDKIMKQFSDGEIDILVATTVIEVGVDVPNATVMVIENAERFGLSQLHQLRGRIGRGKDQSYCILFCQGNGEIAQERMKIMCETNDGMKISEKDLELRGPGEFFGVRQHGLPELKVANLFTDMNILKETQQASADILMVDPLLVSEENKPLRLRMHQKFEEVGGKGILN